MATELAKAYVQIVPSAQGIKSALTEIFDEETDGLGEKVGQSLGAKLVGTIRNVVAAAGIGKMISESINMGGALQQSIGGVETLFGDSADRIKAYASQAYRTAGLSANAYMEQTTSFAASLLSSVSNNTEAAADLANMAMIDMADNANKMGTDMQDIQNAYQGFAKQNYTMLDNLRIGYGGTQAEMQRLLNDAEKISGVHYDLGNLADMYSAIHVIQTELNITGTTAEEAATTLTGSFASMKAAAENVLGNWSTGADLTEPLQALADTARTFLEGNLLPMIGNVLAGIPQIVHTLVPEVLQSGTELIGSLAQGFTEGIPEFLSSALPELLSFTEELRANAGRFVDAGLNLITQLLNGLISGLPQLIAYVPDIVINICGVINDNMPKILSTGINLIVKLIAGIVQAVPSLLANWKKILQAVISVISAVNWLNIGKNILTGIGNGVKNIGTSLLNAFKSAFSHPLEWLKSLPGKMADFGKSILKSFTNGLTGAGGAVNLITFGNMANSPADGMEDILSGWADANEEIADSAQTVADITIPSYEKSGNAASDAAKKVQKAAKTVTESLQWSIQDAASSISQNALGKVTTDTTELTEHMLKSDGTSYDKFTKTITESGKEMVNGVVKNYKLVTKEITNFDKNGKKIGDTVTQTQKTYEEIAATVRDTVTSTTESVLNGIETTTQTVTETLTDETQKQKQVVTETMTDIVNGALVTVEKVKTIAADGAVTTSTTIQKAAADSFSGLQKKWKTEAEKGVLGTFSTLTDAVKGKDWTAVGLWAVSTLYDNLAPEHKKRLDDLGVSLIRQINQILGDAAGKVSQKAWELGSSIAKKIGEALGGSGGLEDMIGQIVPKIVGMLGPIGTALGSATTGLGTEIAGAAASLGGLGSIAEGLGEVISSIGSVIMANPEIAAIIAIVAGVAALGAAIWAIFGKKKKESASSSTPTYKDLQDAYWYGNERAFAGYDYRTDPYTFNPDNSAVLGYQSRMQAQMEKLTAVVQQYLPDVANQQIVLEDGTLVGAMAPGMDAQLGQLAVLAERGN